MKQGDLLFRIDPRPYEYAVDQKKAQLAEAEQNVEQLKASFTQAEAAAKKAQAQLELTQLSCDRQTDLVAKNVAAQVALDTATRNLEAARQTLAERRAAAERARLAFTSQVGGVNTTVASLRADLRNAELNLSETQVVAPTDGYVTQLLLRPGMTASPATPTMVFILAGKNLLSASFLQGALPRISRDNEAEIAFDAVPGRIFKARVMLVSGAISQGQVQASGSLIDPQDGSKSRGRAVVRFVFDDDVTSYQLPAGSSGQVTVYTDHMAALAMIRRILLRMKSWLNYVV